MQTNFHQFLNIFLIFQSFAISDFNFVKFSILLILFPVINTTRIIPVDQVDPDNPDPRILIHNYGFWSSCRKLKKLNYAKPWPTSIRGHQVCIKTENNTQFVYPINVFKYR